MKIDYDELADSYEETRNFEPIIYEILSYLLHPTKEDRILDFGCGTGNYLKKFSVDYDASIYGVEPSPHMRRIAQKKISADHILDGNHLHIPFANNQFNKIYCTDVIHHIEQLDLCFKNLLHTAQTGAKFCICTESSQQLAEKYWIKYFSSIVQVDLKRFHQIESIVQTGEAAGWIYKTTLQTESTVLDSISPNFMERVRKKTLSVLNLIPDEEYEKGISRMDKDYQNKMVFRQQEGYTFLLFEKGMPL